jgi:hypothetical protein
MRMYVPQEKDQEENEEVHQEELGQNYS